MNIDKVAKLNDFLRGYILTATPVKDKIVITEGVSKLDKQIRQLGVSANNFFKKGDIAEGFKELAKGGRDTSEALASLPAIMNAAVVGEMKLAEAEGIKKVNISFG